MMRRAGAYLAAVIAGLALGLGSALWMAGLWPPRGGMAFGEVDVRGWRSDFAIGSEAADPYTRLRVARHGLLALAKTEAVYFTRSVDDDGEPLREACRYRIGGGPMPAGWWSVTLYNSDSMLPSNTDNAMSIDAERAGTGRWAATILPREPALIAPTRPAVIGGWISSRNAGNFDLTLRLYMPEPALLADPQGVLVPPTVQRVDCEG